MKAKLKKIKLLAMDVDGVLTAGHILYGREGESLRAFDVHDGWGLVLLKQAGIFTAVISGKAGAIIESRARDLQIDRVYLDAESKGQALDRLLTDFNLKKEEVAYIGDDWPDIPVLAQVGFAAAVKNARVEVKRAADYVTKKPGGAGAVREVVELILKAQNKWKMIFNKFVGAGILKSSLVILILCFSFGFGRSIAMAQNIGQQLEGLDLHSYTEDGQKAWDVKGATADIKEDTIIITDVNANQYGENQMNLTAQKGIVNKTSGDIHLEKDVVITTKTTGQLTTDSLTWEKSNDLVTTDDKVYLTDKALRAQGVGLVAQPGLKTAKLEKDVRVDINLEDDEKMPSRKVTITCDGSMEIDQASSVATFYDNVVAIQDDRVLKADKMQVHFDPKTQRVEQTICIGNVQIIQGENTTYSDKATYNAFDQKLILSGKPKLIMVTEGEGGIAALTK